MFMYQYFGFQTGCMAQRSRELPYACPLRSRPTRVRGEVLSVGLTSVI